MCVCKHGYLKEKCLQIETHMYWASQAAPAIKILPANAGDLGSIMSWEDSLEEGMQPSLLAWRIPQTEEPSGYSP